MRNETLERQPIPPLERLRAVREADIVVKETKKKENELPGMEVEAKTVTRFMRSDNEAWRELYARQNPKMLSIARKTTSDDIEDAVQNAWLGFVRGINHVVDDNIEGYLDKAAKNSAINNYRNRTHNGKRTYIPEDTSDNDSYIGQVKEIDNVDVFIENSVNASEETRKLKEKFSKNDNNAQLQVLLLYAEGFEYKEIAEKLGIPPGTVMSKLHRARVKAQKAADEIFGAETVEYHKKHLRSPQKLNLK